MYKCALNYTLSYYISICAFLNKSLSFSVSSAAASGGPFGVTGLLFFAKTIMYVPTRTIATSGASVLYIFLRVAFLKTAVLKTFCGVITANLVCFCFSRKRRVKRGECSTFPVFITNSTSRVLSLKDFLSTILSLIAGVWDTGDYELTETRFLPLARRRAMALRPPGVFMRTRKPWLFDRFRFFGLYVNDMGEIIHCFSTNASRSFLFKKENHSHAWFFFCPQLINIFLSLPQVCKFINKYILTGTSYDWLLKNVANSFSRDRVRSVAS